MDTPRPGDFPIGSVESRTEMRLQLSNERGAPSCMEIVSHISRPWRSDEPEPGDWNKSPRLGVLRYCGDGLMWILYVPPSMTADEARKAVGK
jgi:hypothetical protein